MHYSALEVFTAVALAGLGIVAVFAFLNYLSQASDRRLLRMLTRAGVDVALAKRGDTEAIIKDIRTRCRKCQTEDICERWLAGEVGGGNTFCPNHQVFDLLKREDTAESA